MKLSAQILLLLALFGLLSLSFAQKVTVTKTKSFSTSKYYSSSGKCDNNDGSDNEEETETPPINPGADSYNACDPNNRPQVCTKEYAPVCGYINECEGGACTSTFGNKCTACADDNVDGYVNGACEDVQTVCDPDNRPEICTMIYTATCAVAADCQGSHCFQDTSSSCVACGSEGVAYSLPGVCPGNGDDDDDRTYCDANNRPDVCTADYTPVCAHKSNCVGDSCWSTAGNACSACASDNIDYHVPGECSDDDDEEEEGNNQTTCDADNRPEVCTEEYNPVCAHISDCTGNNCWFTAGNACSACGNATVDYHVPGECANDDTDDDDDRTYCDADNRPEICTLEYNPVCAHTTDCTGDNCWNTAGNACGACSDPNVDYHVPGECPDNGNNNEEETNQNGEEDDTNGNGRTECDVDNRPEVCTLEYAPVCAHIIGCEGEGNDCFRTEGNGCGACSLDDVDYYTTGEC